MRLITTGPLICGLLAGFVLAGCGDDDSDAPATTTPAPTTSASAPVGTVASCIVGDWRTTDLPSDTEVGAVNADVAGGSGIDVHIEKSGLTTIDFSQMQPVIFSARIGAADVRGNFVYAGKATGGIITEAGNTAAGTPSASAGEGGTWRPVGDMNYTDTTFTVELTEPVQARPFDDVPLSRYTGDGAEQTGNVVDVDPFFDNGRYTCQGEQLTVTPDEDGDLPLVLERA